MNSKPPRRSLPPKRRPTPAPSAPSSARGARLQKLIAHAGLGSRREIEEWIRAGRVTVNGRIARLGERATASDRIAVDGKPVALRPAVMPRVLLYHKPVGELVTRRDPAGRPTVFDRMPALARGRWIAVGRLDMNSAGLLLFTNAGEVAARLMHPRYGVEREYRVRVLGPLEDAELRRLRAGVALEDGIARVRHIEPLAAGSPTSANRWYRVVLAEGRKREVRRLFEALGRQVSRLVRVRFGPFALPEGLAPGRWCEADPAQVRRALQALRATP
ncbi:MAG: rRNA pseudouridine synthase [Burkholderiales bacterium]|nr:rRNA pseudouridine synthase [Burkholderiales bacterium]